MMNCSKEDGVFLCRILYELNVFFIYRIIHWLSFHINTLNNIFLGKFYDIFFLNDNE